MERRTFLKLAALVPGLALAGCGGSKTLLSPKDPTMLSIWHVYGEQADSPMNRLLTEFNDTVGREKGILLNVTNMTNSAAIGGQLQDAKAGKPGALDLPDLFSAHPADASALGIENLVDWNDWFTAEDMAAYVPGFVQDGIIEGRQLVRSDQRDLPRFVDGVCPGAGAGRYSDLGPVLQHAGDDRRNAGGPWQLCGHPLLQ